MSKNVRFELKLSGLNELMKSAPMQAVLTSAAQSMAATAGEGYKAIVERAHPISFIAIASVRTVNDRARMDNNHNNTLLKARGKTKV